VSQQTFEKVEEREKSGDLKSVPCEAVMMSVKRSLSVSADKNDDNDEIEDKKPLLAAAVLSNEDLSRQCPYLDTIDRNVLDFDFEKLCSVSLSRINVYACLVCGKYFQVGNRKVYCPNDKTGKLTCTCCFTSQKKIEPSRRTSSDPSYYCALKARLHGGISARMSAGGPADVR
jgi:hypothetical protein